MLRSVLQPVMRRVTAKRVRSGKDDPARSGEKLGVYNIPRPAGSVVWVHAVGLGEVLALRPLLAEIGRQAPNVHFLVTSTARSSAQVMGRNLPANTTHQFLPLDGPRFVRGFLDHWRPDLSIWSEQDIWPGIVIDVKRRGIPLAYINARISQSGYEKRAKFRTGFAALMGHFDRVYAQDDHSVSRLKALGAARVDKMGSLKPAAEPLAVDQEALAAWQAVKAGRRIWVAASTHDGDEEIVLKAHREILTSDPAALLIIVPRDLDRAADISQLATSYGLRTALRSQSSSCAPETSLYIADSFGELGLWYRLASHAFVGGSFANIGGHNPWEPICLGCPVLHGPNTQNFARDYADLNAAGVALPISAGPAAASHLAQTVLTQDVASVAQAAAVLTEQARAGLVPLAQELLSMLGGRT
ncbi:3-deoxy-D-manno-octulosonic acid transferase [Shimia sp. R11_0]|uniref:3-deoxy-D-manno-octulosonic acid transferase n=1 Tax=Shimia sp. R11_0 TaxID=2821096 RepID=UPI001ADD3F13|nr:glycosyltransferase N-terminal domain-containing protein [Shimia sp. R11_0]MBO9477733.1 3-deoxy-D-manno-octulosonic acid transferase [Shimia sp. R11_0]